MHLTPRCASHHGVKLRGVHHTAESSSAVCFPPRSQAPRCASHCGVKIKIFGSLWLLLKGQSGEFLFRGKLFYHVRKDLKNFFLICRVEFSNFVIKYLGEIETKFENTLAFLSGAQMG